MSVTNECSICFSDKGSTYPVQHVKNPALAKEVDHFFHKQCINDWAKIKNECPICCRKITHINQKPLDPPQQVIPLNQIRIEGEENTYYLFDAIERGDVDEVHTLLTQAIYIDSDDLGEALRKATCSGNQEMMACLLDDIDFDDEIHSKHLHKALLEAIDRGNQNGALLLLERQGLLPNNGPQLLARAFNICATRNLLDLVNQLLTKKLYTNADLCLGIEVAKRLGHVEMAVRLLKHLPLFWSSLKRLDACTIQ